MSSIETRVHLLHSSQNRDGGWGYFAGRESRVEATSYVLRALGDSDSHWEAGVAYLATTQQKDGGLAPSAEVPVSTWVTNLAFPLLKRSQIGKSNIEAAANWILKTEGSEGGFRQRFAYALGLAQAEQDPRLKGWPWRPGNNSWVEPTAHGLLALHWMQDYAPEIAIRYRRDLSIQMILDRRCSDGGWNYGNKKVLGELLPAYPETTALALLGLAGSGVDAKLLLPSLSKAKSDYTTQKGAYGKALLSLALRLHDVDFQSDPLDVAPHPSGNLMLTSLELLAQSGAEGQFLP